MKHLYDKICVATSVTNLNKLHRNENFFHSICHLKTKKFLCSLVSTLVIITNDATRTITTTT